MTTHVLVLDRTQKWLNANERLHWAKKSAITRYWRDYACLEARRAKLPAHERVRIVCTYHRADRRRFDPANLAPTSKAIVDGLVDAGVIPDDSHAYVVGPDERYGEPGPRRIVVEIHPEEKP